MLQNTEQQGLVMRRKVQPSGVRRRIEVISEQKETSEDLAVLDSVLESISENDLAGDVGGEDVVQDDVETKKITNTAHETLKSKKGTRKYPRSGFGLKWVILSFMLAVVAVVGAVYFVNENTPDISSKVTAMQDGVNAIYPKYTPRGYSLTDIASGNGKVTLNFKNAEIESRYSLVEENIVDDSTGMLSKYVEDNFGMEYTKIDESGMAIYIGHDGAIWVDGGVLFRLRIISGGLTRKQIITIATTK